MKRNINQIQQGDVLLVKTSLTLADIATAKRVKRDKRGIVLAEGEVTGHYHAVEDSTEAELLELGDKILLNVLGEKPVTLKHQEHKPITINPGIWEVGQVVEKDWTSGMVNKVVD